MPFSEIPALTTKTRRFQEPIIIIMGFWRFSAQHSRVHDRRRCEPLGRSGGMLPWEKFKICASKMSFPAFWDHSQWKMVEFFSYTSHWINIRSTRKSSATACHKWIQTLHKVEVISFPHPKLPQSYARTPKGKNGWETTEKPLKTAKKSC